MDSAATFEAHRQFLFSLAYRLTGSAGDAEDLVQEAWIRWAKIDPSAIESPRAWLSTTITRLCLNHLDSARARREEYRGQWLPEPVAPDAPGDLAERADSMSIAFLVMLESLSPAERAVFLLREVFEYEYAEIAGILDRSEDSCRQLLRRAKLAIAQRRPRFARAGEAESVIRTFGSALRHGDIGALLSVLYTGVTLTSDGGGKVPSALNPILGADRVARFLIGVAAKAPQGLEVRDSRVNGQPGFVMLMEGRVSGTWSFEIEEGRIHRIYVVQNPDKLRHFEKEWN
jgi:RNA polymerase sigma-70 factor, ECF subfamily